MKLWLVVVLLLVFTVAAPNFGDGWCGSDEWCEIVWGWGEEGE